MVRNRILFENKEDFDWRFSLKNLNRIQKMWDKGHGVRYISREINRDQHEVFLALYELWMDGKISDLGKAFTSPSTLLVPGKDLIKIR